MSGRRLLLRLALLAGCAAGAQEAPRLDLWRLQRGRMEALSEAGDGPLAAGSLQKPFVARAWAESHPGQPFPRVTCSGGGACWLRKGHGEVGLPTALARSCNAYFLKLAEDTPLANLARVLEEAGFAPAPTGAGEAIGLAAPRLLRIRPSRLLEAMLALVRDPWAGAEAARTEVRVGLREGARQGTAGGLAAGGLLAKTGTVPLGAGTTTGLVLALDGEDFAVLGRLSPGTGAQAAVALAGPLAALRPGTPSRTAPGEEVTVRLFDLLPATAFTVRNVGADPIPDGRGFLGPGAQRPLHPGDRVGPGTLELRAEARGLRRRLTGSLWVAGPRLLARLPRRAYVEGVLAAELPQGDPGLRRELAAAVLRFLAQGRRHPDAEVCDSTHCAWFVGEGPRLEWRTPALAREATEPPPTTLTDAEWKRAQALAQGPGPIFWTSHCGGRPLTPFRLWGRGESTAPPCPRHGGEADPWARTWSRAAVARALGDGVEALGLGGPEGTWRLRVTIAGRTRELSFDEAHRRLATVLGWDALPSPADRVEATAEGWRVSGTGRGHRIGLCLGEGMDRR